MLVSQGGSYANRTIDSVLSDMQQSNASGTQSRQSHSAPSDLRFHLWMLGSGVGHTRNVGRVMALPKMWK
jgi:hypothetical protein